MPPVWRDFGQRDQHEGAVLHTWMGQPRGAGLNPPIIIQDIQIERTWGVACAGQAAAGLFNAVKLHKQGFWRKTGANPCDGIDERRIRWVWPGQAPI